MKHSCTFDTKSRLKGGTNCQWINFEKIITKYSTKREEGREMLPTQLSQPFLLNSPRQLNYPDLSLEQGPQSLFKRGFFGRRNNIQLSIVSQYVVPKIQKPTSTSYKTTNMKEVVSQYPGVFGERF